jgi:hypothetical protein
VEAEPGTNDSSTVVLRVLGPAGLKVQGATVFLSCPAEQVSWTKPTGAADAYVAAGGALNLSLGPDPSVQMFKSKLSDSARDLQVGAYQKTGAALLGSAPLFSVALSLKSPAQAGSIACTATSGKNSIYLDDHGQTHSLTLRLGALTVR